MQREDHPSGHCAQSDSHPSRPIPRRSRSTAIALVTASALALGACGHDRVSQTPTAPKSTLMVPVQSKSPTAPVDEKVGQPARTAQGNVITVYQFQSPAAYAEAGYVVAAADVEVCASSTTIVTQGPGVVVKAGVSPRFFSVQFTDGTLQESQFPGIKDPALPEELFQPGQCVRGWVTFHVAEQKKIAFLLFRSISVFRWAVD